MYADTVKDIWRYFYYFFSACLLDLCRLCLLKKNVSSRFFFLNPTIYHLVSLELSSYKVCLLYCRTNMTNTLTRWLFFFDSGILSPPLLDLVVRTYLFSPPLSRTTSPRVSRTDLLVCLRPVPHDGGIHNIYTIDVWHLQQKTKRKRVFSSLNSWLSLLPSSDPQNSLPLHFINRPHHVLSYETTRRNSGITQTLRFVLVNRFTERDDVKRHVHGRIYFVFQPKFRPKLFRFTLPPIPLLTFTGVWDLVLLVSFSGTLRHFLYFST